MAWKHWALGRMKQLDLSQNELGKRIGATTASMSNLFGKGKRDRDSETRLMPAINAVLGGPPAELMATDNGRTPAEMKARIDAGWDALSSEDRKLVDDLVSSLNRRKPNL